MLRNKLQKDQPKHFCGLTAEGLRAMREFRVKLVSPSLLALPSAQNKYTLDTNACHVQVGSALLQEQPDSTAKQFE